MISPLVEIRILSEPPDVARFSCSVALELDPVSVHVWDFPLLGTDRTVNRFSALLSREEQTRAARFRFKRDRDRFTIARATVRTILATYTGIGARTLHFEYSPHGKPFLAESEIRFSVSHSREIGMLAVARGREAGMDVELVRKDVETGKLAERFFSPRERASLRAIPDVDRVAAFFRCWTSKEAFLKAQGLGLSRSLDSFDVEVDPHRPARVVATRPEADEADNWSLYDIPAEPSYAAALAVQGVIDTITILRRR